MAEAESQHPSPGAPAPAAQRATKTVMLVIPEPFVRDLIASNLRAAGCFPLPVATVAEARRLVAQLLPDVVVLDLDELAHDDLAWPLELSRSGGSKPVRTAMLSSSAGESCGPGGVRCGANLCIAKPFEPRELMSQLLRLLRPPREAERRPRAKPALRLASIELDRQQPTVRVLTAAGWQACDLPWTEHKLLEFLLSEPERARSREAIRAAVWSDTPVDLRTVDQYVKRLRRTLEKLEARDLVKTVSGVGYRLDLAALPRRLP